MGTRIGRLFSRFFSAAETAQTATQTEASLPVGGQVVRCTMRFNVAPPRYPTLGSLRASTDVSGFVPAALIAHKAKSVADGVFATVEALSSEGTSRCIGIDAFLKQLAERLKPCTRPRSRIDGAIGLATGLAVDAPFMQRFLADKVTSRPLGFYVWDEDLRRVFRRDRYLQAKLDEDEAESIWEAIRSDNGLLRAYRHHLARVARFTNPLSRPSLIQRAEYIARGQWQQSPLQESAVFPPSVAPENAYDSVAQFFDAIRAGTCNIEPVPSSGFYAHQLRALEPLLRPHSFPEASRRQIDDEYASVLERLATMNLFLARETHVKQLDLEPTAPAPGQRHWIRPGIKVEPLPSHYAFLADAFRFAREVIEEGWGDDGLSARQRREAGYIGTTVAAGIEEVVALLDTAARVSRLELEGISEHAEVTAGRERLFALWTDPDAVGDARGMVPVVRTQDGRLRVLVFAGWEVHTLLIKLVSAPVVPPGASLGGIGFPLPVPLMREVVIDGPPLDRDEVRRLCDEALSRSADAGCDASSAVSRLGAD